MILLILHQRIVFETKTDFQQVLCQQITLSFGGNYFNTIKTCSDDYFCCLLTKLINFIKYEYKLHKDTSKNAEIQFCHKQKKIKTKKENEKKKRSVLSRIIVG